MPAARCGGPGSPRLGREQQGPGAADGLRGPQARKMSGHGRRGCGSLRGRCSSGTPGGLGPHSPPGPAPSGASMQPAASPGRGDPAAAAATRPWIPAQRIGQQPGGRGGGEEPAGRGAQLLRGPGLPILPAAPQHRCGPAPVRARPLSFRALRTPVLCSPTRDLAAASDPFAHTHPAAALTSVHLFSPIFMGRQLGAGSSHRERQGRGQPSSAHKRTTARCNKCYEETRGVEVGATAFKGEAGKGAIGDEGGQEGGLS